MTTVRRVMALTAVTVALAAAVGISGDRGGGPGRPLLVPGLRFDDVVGLELQVGDRPPVIIALDEGNPRITAPVAAAADENAVRDLISAVAAARLDRTARAAPGLEHPAAILRLRRRAGATTEVQVGATALASGQTWLAIDQRAGLVPSWVAEAIVRDPDSLRRRRPFPAATAITAVELHGPGLDLVLAGSPVRRLDAGVKVPLDPARRDHFLERLAALAVVLPVAVDGPAAPAITIRVPGASEPAALIGDAPCPGHPALRAVVTTAGTGCVGADALAELIALARDLASPAAIALAPIERFDRTTIASLELDGEPPVRLEPDGAGWRVTIGVRSHVAEPDVVRDLRDVLTTPAIAGPAATDAARRARGARRWRLRHPAGDVDTWDVTIAPDGVTIHRAGEPIDLTLPVSSQAPIRQVGPGLRERAILAIDAVTLAAIEATGAAPASLHRGALIDEWLVTAPAGATATAALATLRDLVASLRAREWLAPDQLGRVRRALTLDLDDGPGDRPRRRVTIEVGAARHGGCAIRVDHGDVAALDAAGCAALLAPLTTGAPRR